MKVRQSNAALDTKTVDTVSSTRNFARQQIRGKKKGEGRNWDPTILSEPLMNHEQESPVCHLSITHALQRSVLGQACPKHITIDAISSVINYSV